ncbi:uncharacterized protein LOC114541657 [Dendronephthya gigantea]|uniref:uncharacterized protein LOC114541657 n=1 Tax=Dendronephthya gigantea TaxID=151771 RepID=UPI00106BEC47|nr:uncharacterized protein LOC114541657 [Dendronephthya gigantea]
MGTYLAPMPPFDPDADAGGNIAAKWRTWLADFKIFLTASEITNKTRQRALLLYQAGQRIREIFRHFPDPGNDDDFNKATELLTEYFEPQKNRLYEVYKFRQAQQSDTETIDQYHTRLRTLSKNCEFSDVKFEIMVQIVIGGKSSRVRKQALRDPKYVLKDLLLAASCEEISKTRAADIEGHLDSCNIQAVKTPTVKQTKHKTSNKTCFYCGCSYPHTNKPCPAKNKTCANCGKLNHFASQCRSSSKRENRQTGNPREDLRPVNNKQKHPQTSISLNGQRVKMTIDTGSSINVIDKHTFQQLRDIRLQPTSVKAYPFNSTTPVKMEGKFRVLAESKHKFMDKHGPVFRGLGKLKNKQIELVIDETISPVAQPQRRAPFHLRGKIEDEIRRLERDDIIERIPEGVATEWVFPVVVVPKRDDKIRLCVDMRVANTAIQRTRHPIPTLEAVSIELNGARFFSKLDLTQAYHQLELNAASQGITTFSTHLGLYRYKRLNYSTNATAELTQHTLQETLQGIQGAKNIADDIIVFGNTRKEHDQALEEVLRRLQESNLTLNLQKCKFLKKNLEFFGLVFTEQGVSLDLKKVDAFANQNHQQQSVK